MTSTLGTVRARDYVLQSGLAWVILGFSVIVVLNLITLADGPSRVLSGLEGEPWGAIASVFVFDSWGTTTGLFGVVILFTPLLFGVRPPYRVALSAYFLAASVAIGVAANLLWTRFYDNTGYIGSGSSSIAFAAQAIIFALAILGLLSLAMDGYGKKNHDPDAAAIRQFFFVVYITLIISTLYFVIFLQPIFTPTLLYNWRVHEIAFISGVAATFLYELTTRGVTSNLVASSFSHEAK